METNPTNYEERLSRIETIVSRAEYANSLAHEHFRNEDTMILTSQIALNTAQQRTNEALAKLGAYIEQSERLARREDRKLRLRMRETTEKLDALIRVVDGMVRGGAQ